MSLDDVALGHAPPHVPIPRSLCKSSAWDATATNSKSCSIPARAQVIDRAEDDISVHPPGRSDALPFSDQVHGPALLPNNQTVQSSCSPIEQLPAEILESIIDLVGGQLGPPTPGRGLDAARNWNLMLWYPRRKNISDLALVSPAWRRIVQQRIFRHLKIHGTQSALTQCGNFFLGHQHLSRHVRHLQVMVPLWETEGAASSERLVTYTSQDNASDAVRGLFTGQLYYTINSNASPSQPESPAPPFRPATHNASLSEIFAIAQILFSDLHALSIEGGHCKHSPQIRYFPMTRPNLVNGQPLSFYEDNPPLVFSSDSPYPLPYSLSSYTRHSQHRNSFYVNAPPGPSLPVLRSVKAFILKGAWNIVRCPTELALLQRALPNIQEFHCTYHASKTNAYTTMCAALRTDFFPRSIRHLTICLEGLYSRNSASLVKWRKVYPFHHICRDIGCAMPQLETLSYTGRLCGALFSSAIKAADPYRRGSIRLRSIDIIAQNVCRDVAAINDGTGIANWPFIQAFEMLILQAVRALEVYTNVTYLRIRYIDLDSADALLNPTFHLQGDRAWGLWSPEILHYLHIARPNVRFEGACIGDRCLEFDDTDPASAILARIAPSSHGHKSHSVEYYGHLFSRINRSVSG